VSPLSYILNRQRIICISDGRFTRKENDSIQIFPITTLHDTMLLYKYLKFSEFKHTIKH